MFKTMKRWMKYTYISFYNEFFAGWNYMGGGHYHYFPEKKFD